MSSHRSTSATASPQSRLEAVLQVGLCNRAKLCRNEGGGKGLNKMYCESFGTLYTNHLRHYTKYWYSSLYRQGFIKEKPINRHGAVGGDNRGGRTAVT